MEDSLALMYFVLRALEVLERLDALSLEEHRVQLVDFSFCVFLFSRLLLYE